MQDFDALFQSALAGARVRGGSSSGRKHVATPAPGEAVGPFAREVDIEVPSKRANKNRSGRAGRKAYQGRKWASAVGGTTDLWKAVTAPADAELCKVVDPRRGFTNEGTPFRSPGR